MLALFLTVVKLTLVILLEIKGNNVGNAVWPDYTCHSNFKSKNSEVVGGGITFSQAIQESHRMNKERMDKCVEQEKEKSICAKLCVADQLGLFHHADQMIKSQYLSYSARPATNNITVEIDDFRGYIRKSLLTGFIKSYEKPEEKYQAKVKGDMEQCVKNHPEITTMKMAAPCDKWNPFLSCIDKAFKCA